MSCGKWLCFCFHEEKPTQLFPELCIALVLLVLAGFFSPCSWLDTSPGEQKHLLFPYNGKTSLLWPWGRLGGGEIHGLVCPACRWVCKAWTLSRSRQGLLKACLSSSRVCKHKILAFPSVSFLGLLSVVLPAGNSNSWWCFPHYSCWMPVTSLYVSYCNTAHCFSSCKMFSTFRNCINPRRVWSCSYPRQWQNFSMKPIHDNYPFNLTPRKAMKTASGRRWAGEGCCADSAAASSWEQPQHLDCSQPQNTVLAARIHGVVGLVLTSHFQHQIKLICCPVPAAGDVCLSRAEADLTVIHGIHCST